MSNITQKEFISNIEQSYRDCVDIIRRKNQDYADADNPFKNFGASVTVGVDPAKGILVRLMDKIVRIGNLIKREAAVKDESIEDTIDDACNYLQILKEYLKHGTTK